MNSEDFKCNTCGDYVGEDGVWGLCDPCFDKEGGNEQLGKSLTIHNNSEDFKCSTCGDVADFAYRLCRLCDTRPAQYAVEIVKPRVFDPPMKIKIVKAILAKQKPPKGTT